MFDQIKNVHNLLTYVYKTLNIFKHKRIVFVIWCLQISVFTLCPCMFFQLHTHENAPYAGLPRRHMRRNNKKPPRDKT